ncbi:MAG TPA: M15 family metallopeptidase [Cyclobacteriaceae bacterium]|nr:M15 family metallopeptidase [Cyclobacteriaceae bacterium]
MHYLRLAAVFFGCISFACAQNSTPPWSDDRANTISELTRNFIVPVVAGPAPDTVDIWMKWSTVGNYTFGKNRGDIPMITDLSALHPYFRDKVLQLIANCKAKGIELAVVETYRTVAKQNEYKQLGKIYTRSSGGRSRHQYGLAVDVVPVIDSVPSWHNEPVWKKVGAVGEKLGLRWGGRWRHPYDPGHFEWSGGVSTASMEAGHLPRIPNAEAYPCLAEDLKDLQEYWDKWETEQRSSFVAKVGKGH